MLSDQIEPQVSVLVPCFNGARFLEASLNSVLMQVGPSFEVVVADDASTDASREIVEAYAARDARVRLIASASNRGMTANWNAALGEARGEYVCKLDCDDAYRPGTLARFFDAFIESPEVTAAFCRTLRCDANLEPLGSYLGDQGLQRAGLDPLVKQCLTAEIWYQICFDDIQIWHSNGFMVSRDLLVRRLQGWDSRYSCASDTDFILRLLELGGHVAHLPEVGVWYRTTPGSVSDGGRRAGWVSAEVLLACALSLQRTARSYPISPALRRQRARFLGNLDIVKSNWGTVARTYPDSVRVKLESLMLDLEDGAAIDMLAFRARAMVSKVRRALVRKVQRAL